MKNLYQNFENPGRFVFLKMPPGGVTDPRMAALQEEEEETEQQQEQERQERMQSAQKKQEQLSQVERAAVSASTKQLMRECLAADNLERQDRGCREQQNIEHEPPPSHCLSFRWSRHFVARLRWLTGGENISGNRERGQELFGLTNAHDSHFHVRESQEIFGRLKPIEQAGQLTDAARDRDLHRDLEQLAPLNGR
jgi:hypothetical protein